MPRYLMDLCINNRKDVCNEKVRYARWPKQLNKPSDIPDFPKGINQEYLDNICENCLYAVFIVEAACPFCSGTSFKLAEAERVALYSDLGPIYLYKYLCGRCRRILYSQKSVAC
jgi:hypothetical protein